VVDNGSEPRVTYLLRPEGNSKPAGKQGKNKKAKKKFLSHLIASLVEVIPKPYWGK
jgi:hypothetical protein